MTASLQQIGSASTGADIGGDTGKVVVTGDSAGGNMAAVVAQQMKGKLLYKS